MTERIRQQLKAAKLNKEFLAAIKEADNDNPPGFFADSLTEHLFCAVYYGWLVGKYGNKWRQYE